MSTLGRISSGSTTLWLIRQRLSGLLKGRTIPVTEQARELGGGGGAHKKVCLCAQCNLLENLDKPRQSLSTTAMAASARLEEDGTDDFFLAFG